MLDKHHAARESASDFLVNGSVTNDDNLSDTDGPPLVNGHAEDSNAFLPGGPGSFTGKVKNLLAFSKFVKFCSIDSLLIVSMSQGGNTRT